MTTLWPHWESALGAGHDGCGRFSFRRIVAFAPKPWIAVEVETASGFGSTTTTTAAPLP